jgi:hypothetical protein
MPAEFCECPTISSLTGTIYSIGDGGYCFHNCALEYTGEMVSILIECNVTNVCPECEGRLGLTLSIGGESSTQSVFADGWYQAFFDGTAGLARVLMFPCSEMLMSAQITLDVSPGDCPLPPECPPFSAIFYTPGCCEDGGECGSPSGSSGGSEGSPGSDDSSSGSEKSTGNTSDSQSVSESSSGST